MPSEESEDTLAGSQASRLNFLNGEISVVLPPLVEDSKGASLRGPRKYSILCPFLWILGTGETCQQTKEEQTHK